jgi:hypothetical protein
MNSNAAPHAAPSRLASSRLKNPKLWHATLPVTSVATTAKPVHQPTHATHHHSRPTFHVPTKMLKALPLAALSFSLFLAFIFIVQPSQVQNLPFPDWYAPFHILSFFALGSLLYAVSTKLKISLTLAATFQTLFFFQLQHIEITPIVLLCTLILFGTIGLSAHIIQILTSKHQRTSSHPTLHTLN